MPPTGVALAEAAFEAWNHGQLDRLMAMIDADCVMKHPRDWPEPGPSKGRAAIRRQLEQFTDGFESIHINPREFRTVGERVVVPVEMVMIGGASGAEQRGSYTYVITYTQSIVTVIEIYGADELLPPEIAVG